MGIKLSKEVIKDLNRKMKSIHLLEFDLEKLLVRAKHLNVIDEAEGMLISEYFKVSEGNNRKGLWDTVHTKFSNSVSSNTNNPLTYVRWGEILLLRAQKKSIFDEDYKDSCSQYLREAEEKFMEAEVINQSIKLNIWESYFNWANALVERAVLLFLYASKDSISSILYYLNKASSKYNQAFQLNSNCSQRIIMQSHFYFNEAIKYRLLLFSIVF